jgi:hypothetical protein
MLRATLWRQQQVSAGRILSRTAQATCPRSVSAPERKRIKIRASVGVALWSSRPPEDHRFESHRGVHICIGIYTLQSCSSQLLKMHCLVCRYLRIVNVKNICFGRKWPFY